MNTDTLLIFLAATWVGIGAGFGMGIGSFLMAKITSKHEKEMDITK